MKEQVAHTRNGAGESGQHAPLLACLQQLTSDLSVLLQLAFSSLLELLQFVSLLLQLEHGLVLLGDARRLLL